MGEISQRKGGKRTPRRPKRTKCFEKTTTVNRGGRKTRFRDVIRRERTGRTGIGRERKSRAWMVLLKKQWNWFFCMDVKWHFPNCMCHKEKDNFFYRNDFAGQKWKVLKSDIETCHCTKSWGFLKSKMIEEKLDEALESIKKISNWEKFSDEQNSNGNGSLGYSQLNTWWPFWYPKMRHFKINYNWTIQKIS